MLTIIRVILVFIFLIILCTFGILWCLLSPHNPNNVAILSHLFGKLSYLFGIKLEIRKQHNINQLGNVIYISNHQNNYDMITASNIVQKSTVTIGKKSIIWIPLFGILYWLSGNLLINRKSPSKAHSMIYKLVNTLQQKNISFWIFPEGTRSNTQYLLPFKTGAFHVALMAKVPIVPIVVSNTNKIKLNRFNNGLVIVEMLMPIDITKFQNTSAKKLTDYCHNIMEKKLIKLNAEVNKREKSRE